MTGDHELGIDMEEEEKKRERVELLLKSASHELGRSQFTNEDTTPQGLTIRHKRAWEEYFSESKLGGWIRWRVGGS